MHSALFTYTLLVPAAILSAGLFVMGSAFLREDIERFRKGLYFVLASCVVTGFFLTIRLSSPSPVTAHEIALVCTSVAVFAAAAFAVSYHYIHRMMPEFFINSSLIFSVACWIVLSTSMIPSFTSKASSEHHNRFVESQQYQTRKAAASAALNSNHVVASLP